MKILTSMQHVARYPKAFAVVGGLALLSLTFVGTTAVRGEYGEIGIETSGYEWIRTANAASHDAACTTQYGAAHVCVEWCEVYHGANLVAPTGQMCCDGIPGTPYGCTKPI